MTQDMTHRSFTAPAPAPTIAQVITQMQGEIARALPKHMDADRMYLDWYRTLTGHDATYVLVVVESTEPYWVAPYTLTTLQLDAGREKWETALDLYAECVATDTWPGYSPDPQPIEMPAWALY